MYVYVMENPHTPGMVKIGRSVDPERRRDELAKGTGVPGRSMNIVASRWTGSDTVTIEGAMHDVFEDVKQGDSEWFRVDADEAVEALDIIIESRKKQIQTQTPTTEQEETTAMDYNTAIPTATSKTTIFVPAQSTESTTTTVARPESFSPVMARHIDEIKMEAARVEVAQLVARCAGYLGSVIVRINEDMDAIQGKGLDECNEAELADRVAYLGYNYGVPVGFKAIAPKGLLDADERRVLMLMDRERLVAHLVGAHGSAVTEAWVREVALDMAEYRMALMEIKLGLAVETDHHVPNYALLTDGGALSEAVLDAVFAARVALAATVLGLSMEQVVAQFHDGDARRPRPFTLAKPVEVKRMGVWGRRK